jgi:hypothetical protein
MTFRAESDEDRVHALEDRARTLDRAGLHLAAMRAWRQAADYAAAVIQARREEWAERAAAHCRAAHDYAVQALMTTCRLAGALEVQGHGGRYDIP